MEIERKNMITCEIYSHKIMQLWKDFVTPFQKQNILKFLRDEMIKNSYLNSDSRERERNSKEAERKAEMEIKFMKDTSHRLFWERHAVKVAG